MQKINIKNIMIEDINHQNFSFHLVSNCTFFRHGLETLGGKISLSRRSHNTDCYYFVDFSSENFSLFIDKYWMDHFPEGALIILFPDKKMYPIANYWFYHSSNPRKICAVVNEQDKLKEHIEYILSGKLLYPNLRSISLSDIEFVVLNYMIRDSMQLQRIANITQISSKKIYAIKRNIEKKLSAKINTLLRV